MIRLLSPARVILGALVAFGLGVAVAKTTQSWILTIASIGAFFFLHGLAIVLLRPITLRAFARLVNENGEQVLAETADTPPFARGMIFFDKKGFPAKINMSSRGITIYKPFFLSVLIAWPLVESLRLFAYQGLSYAELSLKRGSGCKRMWIPWKSEFEPMVPCGTLVRERDEARSGGSDV
jgi:hypothetical protein